MSTAELPVAPPTTTINVTISPTVTTGAAPATPGELGMEPGGYEAAVNVVVDELSRFMNGMVDASGLPPGMQEQARDVIAGAGEFLRNPSDGNLEDFALEILANVIQSMNEEIAEEATGTKAGERNGGRGVNWLVLMAKALGAAAGNHLQRSIELAEKIGAIGGAESFEDLQAIAGPDFQAKSSSTKGEDGQESLAAAQARATTMLQAEMQAETQLFKMIFEAASTLIKTTGEGFSTMARKQ